MSHEITSTDHLVLAQNDAWHGLGSVVESAPTPGQALALARLDWTVEESAGLFSDHENADETMCRTAISTHKALRRSDTGDILGVVGSEYCPLQNEELMQFTYALAEKESDVRVESAGSLRGGRRIWTLLRTETMTVNDNDAVVPYVLCFSSHDGSSSVEFMPTSVRVVCNNTLTAARKRARGNKQRFHFRHTQGLMDRLDAAASDMRMCFTNVREWMKRCDEQSRVNWSSSDVQEFFVKVYEELWSGIPCNEDMRLDLGDIEVPTAAKRARTRHAKAVKTVAEWSQLFDRSEEQHIAASPWKAANAVTNWLDHYNRVVMRKGSTHESEGEARIHNNLFGTTAAQKAKVMKLAGCGM